MPLRNVPLPSPLSKHHLLDILPEDMPNRTDVMSLEGVAVQPLLRSARKLAGVASSGARRAAHAAKRPTQQALSHTLKHPCIHACAITSLMRSTPPQGLVLFPP